MKKLSAVAIGLLSLPFVLTSCELVGDIFQAGLVIGILVVVVVVILIIWILRKIF